MYCKSVKMGRFACKCGYVTFNKGLYNQHCKRFPRLECYNKRSVLREIDLKSAENELVCSEMISGLDVIPEIVESVNNTQTRYANLIAYIETHPECDDDDLISIKNTVLDILTEVSITSEQRNTLNKILNNINNILDTDIS